LRYSDHLRRVQDSAVASPPPATEEQEPRSIASRGSLLLSALDASSLYQMR